MYMYVNWRYPVVNVVSLCCCHGYQNIGSCHLSDKRLITTTDSEQTHTSQNSQCLYSLSGRTSSHKIAWSLEVAILGFILFQSFCNWQAPGQRRCRDVCRISESCNHYKISRLRDFTRYYDKTWVRSVNKGQKPFTHAIDWSDIDTRWPVCDCLMKSFYFNWTNIDEIIFIILLMQHQRHIPYIRFVLNEGFNQCELCSIKRCNIA